MKQLKNDTKRNLYIVLNLTKNMKKILFTFALIAGVLLSSMASAYPYYSNYYGPDNYDRYSLQSSRTTSRGGFVSSRDNSFNKETSARYLSDGTYERTTHFMTTTRQSPQRPTGTFYRNSPRYNSGYYNNNYYDDSNWYMKNWDNRNIYNYNSYPRYSYRYGYNY